MSPRDRSSIPLPLSPCSPHGKNPIRTGCRTATGDPAKVQRAAAFPTSPSPRICGPRCGSGGRLYPGATDTTPDLLNHWFGREPPAHTPAGEEFEFRYYFCQREAIETLIYLNEVRRLDYLSRHGRVRRPDARNRGSGHHRRRRPLEPLCLQDGDRLRQDQGHEPGHRLELLPRSARADSPWPGTSSSSPRT